MTVDRAVTSALPDEDSSRRNAREIHGRRRVTRGRPASPLFVRLKTALGRPEATVAQDPSPPRLRPPAPQTLPPGNGTLTRNASGPHAPSSWLPFSYRPRRLVQHTNKQTTAPAERPTGGHGHENPGERGLQEYPAVEVGVILRPVAVARGRRTTVPHRALGLQCQLAFRASPRRATRRAGGSEAGRAPHRRAFPP